MRCKDRYLSLVLHAQQEDAARVDEGGDVGHPDAALEGAVHLLEHEQHARAEVDQEQVRLVRVLDEDGVRQVRLHRRQLPTSSAMETEILLANVEQKKGKFARKRY